MIGLRTKRKIGFVTALFSLLFSLGIAAQVSTNQTVDTLEPGENQTLAQISINATDNETRILDTTDNFPFPVWLVNTTRNVTAHTANNSTTYSTGINATVVVRLPHDFQPGNRSNTLHLILPTESHELTFDYTVREVRNWTVAPWNLSQNVSVGSNGLFGEVVVRQEGNADQEVSTNLTGNLSQFLKVEPGFDVHPDTPHTARITFQVPESTQFGNYSGQLVLASGDDTRTVNLSAVFHDEIPPRIQDVDIPDRVMATTTPLWTVEVDDNLEVASVVGNVTREIAVTHNNTTVRQNTSVATVAFSHREHTDEWNASFTETAERGRYYVNLTAVDTAGNPATTLRSFEIRRLDSLEVVAENFEFDSVRPTDAMTRDVFRIDTATPVTVTLTSFTELNTNDSMVPGIRHRGEASADTFDGVGGTVTVSEPGTYELVVETEEKGRFKGKLNYSVVPQHVAVPETVFSGQFIDPECPEETTYESGEFEYEFGYTGGGCLTGKARLVILMPGETCKGYADPSTCVNIKGLDFGRIDALEAANDKKDIVMWGAVGVTIVVVFVVTVAFWFDRRRWPFLDFELTKEAD